VQAKRRRIAINVTIIKDASKLWGSCGSGENGTLCAAACSEDISVKNGNAGNKWQHETRRQTMAAYDNDIRHGATAARNCAGGHLAHRLFSAS